MDKSIQSPNITNQENSLQVKYNLDEWTLEKIKTISSMLLEFGNVELSFDKDDNNIINSLIRFTGDKENEIAARIEEYVLAQRETYDISVSEYSELLHYSLFNIEEPKSEVNIEKNNDSSDSLIDPDEIDIPWDD